MTTPSPRDPAYEPFLERYRRRPDLPHQYGPSLVRSRPGRFLASDVYEIESDEMGRDGYRPLLFTVPPRPEEYRPLVSGDPAGRGERWQHELRLVDPSDDELRAWKAVGFETAYVRRAMASDVPDGDTKPVLPSLAERPEQWPEFKRLANDAFGLTLNDEEFARQGSPPWWNLADVVFACDAEGRMRASAQLIVDHDAAGDCYGVVRALAVDPAVRQVNSVSFLLHVHQSLLARLRHHGAGRCYVQADEDNAGLRQLYELAGYQDVARVLTLRSTGAV
jgi:hypothetical protein